MNAPLFQNPGDGANCQAKAVLAYLQKYDGIEESWDAERSRYLAQPTFSRWENCLEQGYVVCMRSKDFRRQINIAFFEHRNSDCISAVEWEQCTTNAPCIETAEFGEAYSDKFDTSHDEPYGNCVQMADWIDKRRGS